MATTYYANSAAANDLGNGLTPGTAKKHIANAVALATAPDDVVSCTGNFDEQVTSVTSGTSGHPITITGNGTATWTNSSAGVTLAGAALKITDRSNLTITGFTFQNIPAKTIVDFTFGSTNVQNISITNNTFSNCGNQGQYPCTNLGPPPDPFPDPIVGRCGSDDNSRIIYFHGPGGQAGVNIKINNNTFTSNYGAMIWFIRVTSGEIKSNISTGVKSSRSGPDNGNQFLFRLLCHVGNGGNIIIDGNTITNAEADNYVLSVVGNHCGQSLVSPCKWQGSAIKFDVAGSNNTVTNNTIGNINLNNVNAVSQGIFAESNCDSNDIRNNIIYNFLDGAAIKIGSVGTNIALNNSVNGNTIFNAGCSISLINQNNTSVRNNIIHTGSEAGAAIVYRTNVGTATFSNNLYYDPSGGSMSWAQSDVAQAVNECVTPNKTFAQFVTATGETNSLTGNPLFTSEVTPDFHLQNGSPAIGSGIGGIDMGAYPANTITSPIISNVQVLLPNYARFTVAWATDIVSDSQVDYGLTTAYGSTSSDSSLLTSHNILITGLTATTLYHFRVNSRSGGGILSTSGDFKAVTVLPRPTPVVIA